MSATTIRNNEVVAPGTFVRGIRGHVVYEVIETEAFPPYLAGRMRDTRTGRSVGWKYLDTMVRCNADGSALTNMFADEVARMTFAEVRDFLLPLAANSETRTRAKHRNLSGSVALTRGHSDGYWGCAADMYRLLTGREPE